MEDIHALELVPDDELLRRLDALLRDSRHAEADLVAHVGEADARRLYAREASPSMFAYCTEVLHLSEAEAYLRIAAARASREHPVLLTMLADGRLHLTAIAKLAPHLTAENRDVLLQRATHRTKRQVEELVAELAPRSDVQATIRKLPERRTTAAQPSGLPPSVHPQSASPSSAAPESTLQPGPDGGALPTLELRPDGVVSPGPGLRLEREAASDTQLRPDAVADPRAADRVRPAAIEPLAPARYRVQFTASAELRDKLERLQVLMRSSVPDGDLAAVIDAAVTEKLERLEARRFARTTAPRKAPSGSETSPRTRQIPAAVKRAVNERDGGRCRYVDEQGRRCTARDGLEFHHRHPFALGGDHSPENVSLLCRAHNGRLAEVDYGRAAMARHRRPSAPSPSRSLQN
jgi:5-methylcytosine-specific restriction endonuclease McrA